MTTVITRFAPSPTGRLHLGHAWSAMLSHDFARARAGRFLLRIEDIDPGRTREAFVSGIIDDLEWLGLRSDGPVLRQSSRYGAYQAALDRLRAMGLLYRCFCTRRDIARSMAAPHDGENTVYPGTCRHREDSDQAADARHCWRIDMTAAVARTGPLSWHDSRRGTVAADPLALGDVVIARKDAPSSYHLAVAVDDAAQGVTDVIRGEDLFQSTHVHRVLQALLGLPVPLYHHHPLLTDDDGERLAKRNGAPSLEHMRLSGADPVDLLTCLRAGSI